MLDALQFRLVLFVPGLTTVIVQFHPIFVAYEQLSRAASSVLPIVQLQGAAMVFPWNVNVNVPLVHSLLGIVMVVCVVWFGESDPFDTL